MDMTKHYALIKWVAGEDKGKYTCDVPIDWIKNFDYEEYLKSPADSDESYVIEWRDTKKPPRGGWKCYDGLIIQISDRLVVLEKIFNMIQGQKSPKTTAGVISSFAKASEKSNGVNNPQVLPSTSNNNKQHMKNDKKIKKASKALNVNEKPQDSSSLKKDNVRDLQNSNDASSESENDSTDVPAYKKRKIQDLETSDSDENSPHKLKNPFSVSGVKALDLKENLSPNASIDKSVVRENRQRIINLEEKFENMQKLINDISGDHANSTKNGVNSDKTKKMVEIHPGSGVKVTEAQWTLARTKSSFTSMGISLMLALIPMDVLLRSNLKGGASKKKGANKLEPTRTALDLKIMNAIKGAVQAAFPSCYSQTALGIAINGKLNKLRQEHQSENADRTTNAQTP